MSACPIPSSTLNTCPSKPPPPSHFAAIDDAAAVPYLNEPGRALYRKFLAAPPPRAFVLSSKAAYSESEGFDPLAYGLRLCLAEHPDCGVYAYDDEVVWTGPTAAQAPAGAAPLYRATVAFDATATLNLRTSSWKIRWTGRIHAWIPNPLTA